MRQLCPNCGLLSSENAIACGYCGTSFLPAIQTQPTEPPASPKETMPAPQPDEFVVSHSENGLTITWGADGRHKAYAAYLAVMSLALFVLSIAVPTDAYTLVIAPLFLLCAVYWLIALFGNRTVLRLSDKEWIVRRGPVPLPNRDFYYPFERRFDPRKYGRVIAVETPDKEYSRGRTSRLKEILVGFVFGLADLGSRRSRESTHVLYARTPSGDFAELVTGLQRRQARFLARQFQDVLDAGEQPASAEPTLEWLAEAAGDEVAVGEGRAETAGQFVSCPACEAANPADSAFCGECGTVLNVVEL